MWVIPCSRRLALILTRVVCRPTIGLTLSWIATTYRSIGLDSWDATVEQKTSQKTHIAVRGDQERGALPTIRNFGRQDFGTAERSVCVDQANLCVSSGCRVVGWDCRRRHAKYLARSCEDGRT
ncbi:hypothetical protein F5Y08DRAFT_56618 [Xylaria arbuscula]|nr:hypothetical protein F5Y08DRAFT_56618 [Xylaria arbuscula]